MILSRQLNFRLTEEEWQTLNEQAKVRNRKPGELARSYVRNGMNGHDPKHELLVYRFEMILDKLEQLEQELLHNSGLSSGAFAAAIMLMQLDGKTPEELKTKRRENVERAIQFGRTIATVMEDKLVKTEKKRPGSKR